MGKIKKILENELVGGTQSIDVYPVTSTKAVYDTDNKVLNDYIQHLKKTSTFAGIATPTTNPGTPDGPVFYFATKAGTYSNFNNIEVLKGEFTILKWNNDTWTKSVIKPMTDFNSVFDTNGKSLTELESGIIYDVSALNDGAAFESLQALLSSSNLSILIPTSVRQGGMSIRFIQGSVSNSDKKYVRFNYIKSSTAGAAFTNVNNWAEIKDLSDNGEKLLVTTSSSSKVDGTDVIITDFSFVYVNINNVVYRKQIVAGTYSLNNINSVLYVNLESSNAKVEPQVEVLSSSIDLFTKKNIAIIAYSNSNGDVFLTSQPVTIPQVTPVIDKKISVLDARFSHTNKLLKSVETWQRGAYDSTGTIKQVGGQCSEVSWDASWPEKHVIFGWSLGGSVRHILAKDSNDNITSIFHGNNNNIVYPVIAVVPANTQTLLVTRYNYPSVPGTKDGNGIYEIIKAGNGNFGLTDKSSDEIEYASVAKAKEEILKSYQKTIKSFPNSGRLNRSGVLKSHPYAYTTDFISLEGVIKINSITACFAEADGDLDYCAFAFYSADNEESFISSEYNTSGGTRLAGPWVLKTFLNVAIPLNAKYIRVTRNPSLTSEGEINITVLNNFLLPIYSDAYGIEEYFTYNVDCGSDDIEDALKSTSIQGQTILGTDNGYIRFASNYSKDGQPTPLVILNHGGGGRVTSSSTENGSSSFAKLLAKKGYNVLCINGVPTTFRNTKYMNIAQNGAAAHMGGWVYQISAISAYKYVTQKYNISREGCAVIGRSMGGVTSLNLAMLGSIPVKVLALDAPVIDSYKDAYFSGNWSGGTLDGGTAAIFAWIFQWDYCDFTNDTYTIPVGTYTIHGDTYNVALAEAKSLSALKSNTTDMIIMWYLNRNKMAGYNAYKTANFLISNLDNNYVDNQTTDNDDVYFGKKLPCPCKIWFGSGDHVNQQIIAQRFIQIVRNGGSIGIYRTVPTNNHCVWEVKKALDETTDISVVEDGIICSPYGVELVEWIMRYLPNTQ